MNFSAATQKQIDLIERWIEAPLRKLGPAPLPRLQLFCQPSPSAARQPNYARAYEEFQQRFLAGDEATRAGRLQLDEEDFWQNAIAALAPKEHISHHANSGWCLPASTV